MGVDQRELRDAFGCFATGVTIVTTVDRQGGLFGLTANSFTSLSLDPPLALFCLDHKAMSFAAFSGARSFAVNVLGEGQETLSSRFATSSADKWDGIAYETWETGCPVLAGCLAVLECDKEAVYEGGDHVIIVGRVRRTRRADDGRRPLLYYRGRYDALSA